MGLLTSIRESSATFLTTDVPSGASAYFTPALPLLPIIVITEKLGTVEDRINKGLTQTGVSVLIATVVASDAQNQLPDRLYFGKVLFVARCFENPKANLSKVACSDLAEATAFFLRKFKPFGAPMLFMSIGLGKDPTRLCYDVIFNVATGTMTTPVRS